jgi:hypothetical protein
MTEPFILYDNIFDNTVTATDTEATGDYNVAYIQDLRPYTYWKAASLGTKHLTIDAGAATAADSLAIFSHNLGTASATVSLESSTTGAWGGEEVEQIAGFVPTTDLVIMKTFTSATIRYWRVKIVTAGVAPYLGVCILGARLDFPVYPDSPFTPKTEAINATAEISKGGHLLGVTSRYSPLSFSVNLTWPPMSWVDGDFKTFWENHGRQVKPFFWVPNFTTWADRTYFVRFPASFSLSAPQSDTTNADNLMLSFEGIAE